MQKSYDAFQRFHFNAKNEDLPGREPELQSLTEFLKQFVKNGCPGDVMYVSGVPGTGKTATVLRAVASIPAGNFEFIFVNGMEVAKPMCIYQEIYRQIRDFPDYQRPPGPHTCLARLEQLFSSGTQSHGKRRIRRILVVDEVDFLVTRDQKILYSLFEWPNLATAHLCLIAISNTMNLPELVMPRCRSRMGFRRLDFHSYTAAQIEKILRYRLSSCIGGLEKTFSSAALEFCAKKVAGYSGDLRRGLYVCRKALEIRDRLDPTRPVSMRDIKVAEETLYSSPEYQAIQRLPFLAKVLLATLVIAVHTALEARSAEPIPETPQAHELDPSVVPFHQLCERFLALVSKSGILPIAASSAPSIVSEILATLEAIRLIQVFQYMPLEVKLIERRCLPPPDTTSNKSGLATRKQTRQRGTKTPRGEKGSIASSATGRSCKDLSVAYRKVPSHVVDEEGGDVCVRLAVEMDHATTALGRDPFCSRQFDVLLPRK